MQVLNRELLNLADYEKKDVVRYLLNNYGKLERWANMGDTVALSIKIDLDLCLQHEYLEETQREILLGFYIEQSTLSELGDDFGLTPTGVKYWIDGGVNRVWELLNGYTIHTIL